MSDKLAAAMHGFEPVEIAGVVHDNQYCADSAYADAEDWEEWQGYDTGCHDGEVCGPCGAIELAVAPLARRAARARQRRAEVQDGR